MGVPASPQERALSALPEPQLRVASAQPLPLRPLRPFPPWPEPPQLLPRPPLRGGAFAPSQQRPRESNSSGSFSP